jgi:hypothetical protein
LGERFVLGILERADRAIERGPCGPQLGEHVDRPRDRLGAQHERADALSGFDQAVVDQQLLGLPDRVQAGHLVVLHQRRDRRELTRRWRSGS